MFSVIRKEGEYMLVDQVKIEEASRSSYIEAFDKLFLEWQQSSMEYLSLLMDASFETYLLKKGFHQVSSIVEYTRSLDAKFSLPTDITVHCLANGAYSDKEFAELYELARSGTANKNNLFTIEQIMESLPNELGATWRSNCFIFTENETPLGIGIPHIEQGKTEEGRMFYFGVLPDFRQQSYGAKLHLLTLHEMKKLGATTYVGSTDENNYGMIRIFEKNGASKRDHKGIYRINRK
ncbi:GNAT family N-acetyltransferase [Paenisporosarcina cavernae]|uniref:GNAT family N-acetyltransferase n=1 Tax=Paenisporosarcina cavernae TaxID=2320858 RepID=A0A385YS15_9BACL|nr:GNAT family N-acetyltransferase [Paenisporosarcina cavernae]AYC28538.1 GNAT family N-acetyltransferase [Paenisporosarcina cavernae]